MIKFIFLFFVVSINLTVQAAEVLNTIPIFSQKLGVQIPPGWKPTTQQNSSVYLMEFIPSKEKIEAWTQLIAITGIKDGAAQYTPQKAYEAEMSSVKVACPQDFVSTEISKQNYQGYESYQAIMGCKKGKFPQSELAFYLLVKGKKDLYMLKKSFKNKDLNQQNYKTLAPEILTVKICKNDKAGPTCIVENK